MRTLTYTNPNNVSIVLSDVFYGITSVTGLGVPGLEIQEKKAPYQDGATFIDQLFDIREIVVEGTINTGSLADIYGYRRTMSAAFNPKLGPGTLTYENDNGAWLIEDVTPMGPEFANMSIKEGPQRWQITFHCYDPYWYNPVKKEYTLSGTGTLSVSNAGDVECPLELVVYGPITNPKIIDNTTGKYLQIIKDIADGEYVIFYTKFGQKTVSVLSGATPLIEFDNYEILVDGVALSEITRSNGMQYLNLSSTFFSIGTGTSELELIDGGTHTGMSMQVSYRERYVGV